MDKHRWVVTEHNCGAVKVEEQERLYLLFIIPIWFRVDRNALTFFSTRADADAYIFQRKNDLLKEEVKSREIIEL